MSDAATPASGKRPYLRTTKVDFLDRCAPRIAAFYRFWDGKRQGRTMPTREDFDPLEMRDWLPGIVLVDVQHNPRRLTYRLVGTRSVELKQRDVTGQTVEEGYHGASLDDILENYRLVIEGCTVLYDWEAAASQSGYLQDIETLMLPLSANGETVNMVMVYFEVASYLPEIEGVPDDALPSTS
ncbi:MAG TPA: PAS domain-containing protein [Dongiaceae bacterium]|nr:PAS domain-containing protein [Dongiaceae bacterium]